MYGLGNETLIEMELLGQCRDLEAHEWSDDGLSRGCGLVVEHLGKGRC
jgi:hypothetical protein